MTTFGSLIDDFTETTSDAIDDDDKHCASRAMNDVLRMAEMLSETEPSASTGTRRHRILGGTGAGASAGPRKCALISRPPSGGLHSLFFGGWIPIRAPTDTTMSISVGDTKYEQSERTAGFDTEDFTSREAVTYAEELCKNLPWIPTMRFVTSTVGPGVIPASASTWRGGARASLGTGTEALGVATLKFKWRRIPVTRWSEVFRTSPDIPVIDAAGDTGVVDASSEMFWSTPMAGMLLMPHVVPGATVQEVVDAVMCRDSSERAKMTSSDFIAEMSTAIGDIPLAYSEKNRSEARIDNLFPFSFTDAGFVYKMKRANGGVFTKRSGRRGESLRIRRDGDRIFPIVLLPFLLLMDLSPLERYRLKDALERFKSEIVDSGFGPSVMALVDRFGRSGSGELSDRRSPARARGDPNDARSIGEAAANASADALLEGLVCVDLMRKAMTQSAPGKKKREEEEAPIWGEYGRSVSLFAENHLSEMLESLQDGSGRVKDASLRIVARGFTVNLEQATRAFDISTASARAFDASMGVSVAKMAERIAFLEQKLAMKDAAGSSPGSAFQPPVRPKRKRVSKEEEA